MAAGRFPHPGVWFGLLALILAGCATPKPPTELPTPSPPEVPPSPDPRQAGPGPESLQGWADEDHLVAFQAYVQTCHVARDPAASRQCDRGRLLQQTARPVTPSLARNFFETGFSVIQAATTDGGPGLLTAYFAPEYEARHIADDVFDAPVLPRPEGWTRGWVGPERAEIEALAPPGQALAWMRTEDLFFLQIQGSGYLTFEDGSRARAAYAGDNGRPFVGIARPMAEQGLLPPNGTSGEAIRTWLAEHRGPQARAVTALNPRYIYFSLAPDDGGHPAGAAGIPLPERRAIAVDPASWTYGDLVWISADGGNLPGARNSYRGLVMALDTGAAIRGPVRADFYMGRGPLAGEEAGTVRHPLRMWRLIPR